MNGQTKQFKAAMLKAVDVIDELEQQEISIKGVVINDAGVPVVMVHKNEQLTKLIESGKASQCRLSFDLKQGGKHGIYYVDGCRVMWSESIF